MRSPRALQDSKCHRVCQAPRTLVEQMLDRTDTLAGRWYAIEAESKRYARVKVMETTISAIEQGLRERGLEPPPPQ